MVNGNVRYLLSSVYTGNKMSNQSDVLAVVVFDLFSKEKKKKQASRERERACGALGVVWLGEGARQGVS